MTSDLEAYSPEAMRAIRAAKALMRGESGPETKEQLHERLLRLLSDLDSFWPRWIVYLQGCKTAHGDGLPVEAIGSPIAGSAHSKGEPTC